MYKENRTREEGVLPEEFEELVWAILAGNAGCFTVDAEAPEMGQSSNAAKRLGERETRCDDTTFQRCFERDESIELPRWRCDVGC
jgi:hypothetical protein